MSLLQRLWHDESGGLQSCELVFLSAILVIGIVPGITLVRDALLCELSDFACAICEMDCGNHGHGNGNGNGHDHDDGPPGQGWHNGWHHGHWPGASGPGQSGGTSGRGVVTAGQLFAGGE